MKKKDFDIKLKEINLSRQDFANITNLSYSTIGNWHDINKPIPGWVESWLENYIEKQKLETLKQTLKNAGVCSE